MKKKIFNIIWILMLVIAVGVLIFAGIKLYSLYKEYKEVDDTNNEIISLYTENEAQDTTDGFKVNWDELLSVNKDIIAWIRIPDTNINYPIVKGSNNNQYLRHNIYHKYSYGGCIFTDSFIENPFGNMNTIIYGHNLNNGAMFSGLKKYSDSDYANEHRTVYIYLPNGSTRIYRIFAFSKVNANNYDMYDIDVENLKEYYKVIGRYNQLKLQNEVDISNPVLTLSTCTNHNKQERYVVQAYLEF